LDIFLSNFFKN